MKPPMYRIVLDFPTAEEALGFFDGAKAAKILPTMTELYRSDCIDGARAFNARSYVMDDLGERWSDTSLRAVVEHTARCGGRQVAAWGSSEEV